MYNFPWTNFHELNLDWILSIVKEAKDVFDTGRTDIDYAVETADEAKTIATQAAEATIADNSISTPKIQNEAVTTAKLANNSVTSAKIVDGTITGNDIAENTITNYNIQNGSILGADLADETITTDKIADGAVNMDKLAEIVSDSITDKVLSLVDVPVYATIGNIIEYTNSAITQNHVLVECVFDNPDSIKSDVTWITSAGNLVCTGTSATVGTANIVLVKKDN